MISAAASLIVLAWLPGAVVFRLPVADRDRRAALPAEERVFWQIVISLAITLAAALALAAVHRYSLPRLVIVDAVVATTLAAVARFRLVLNGTRPGTSALIVAALVALGLWRFPPPAEYIIGGKDPGTYVNEGVLLAQRGTLVYHDPLVTAVPAATRELFFPAKQEEAGHFGSRFMGFPILDLEAGEVVGQFPHLFPAAIAVGYGLDGLTGVRYVTVAWALLGLVAFYFAAARLSGTTVAAAAAALLALHVVEVWFSRYPNAEVMMQALLFAALLANARAQVDGDRFFAPVAGVLLSMLLLLRIDTVLAIAAVVGANLLLSLRGRPLSVGFLAPLAAGVALAAIYLAGPMRAYAQYPLQFVLNFRPVHWLLIGAGATALVGLLVVGRRSAIARRATDFLPSLVTAALCALAVYALFFREPAGKLALENAYALRMYANFYATVPAVFAALVGFALLSRTSFWRDPALLLTVAVFCVFFFYKIRIVPEHFWAARRFLPVILPATILLACTAAFWGLRQGGVRRLLSAAIGVVFVALLASQYVRAAAPVVEHVEYAGIVPELEQLAGRVGDDDLLLVESRDAGSDTHVFALPLAYIYDRKVLVLAGARPDRASFATFLDWASTRYRRVLFLGSGGTDLLSRHWTAEPVASQRFQVPEYESALNALPRGVRRKEFDFGLYELRPSAAPATGGEIDLDVGVRDDLQVVRFHAKEQAEGRTMRWSQRQSFVTLPGFPRGAREVVLVMSSGGRPAAAPPANVTVYLDERTLGTVLVEDRFKAYPLAIPADVAARAASADEPARLRLVTAVWNPHDVIGSPDDRELGVMLDRVQVR